jgi:2-succinyl-6-hydroxy-2,4-cyclohexadiene-1-carboxylate synthase
MGGRLAFYMAVHFPKTCDKVIIESASPGLKTKNERSVRVEHDAKVIERLLKTPFNDFLTHWYDQPLFSTMDKSSWAFRELIERRLLNDPHLLARSLYNMGTGAQPSLWSHLGSIESQLLLIVGERDAKFKNIADQVKVSRPATQTAIIDDAGHNVHFESPEKYIEQVSLFLKS